MMKRIFTFTVLMLAFAMNAVAWEPVIKERHWFGGLEYDENLANPNDDYGGLNSEFVWKDNSGDSKYLLGIKSWANNHQGASSGWGDRHALTTFYNWSDDSGNDPKPRFRVNVYTNWAVGRNNSSDYHGIGLKENQDENSGTNFWILDLKTGDKLYVEFYYNSVNPARQAFKHQGIEIRKADGTVIGDGDENATNNKIESRDNSNNPVYYTCQADGDLCLNFPGQSVIRCITIVHSDNSYKKATTKIEQIHDEQNNIGYEMTLTGSGVLEDKYGAVPYLTMRFGDMNDMTYVKYLGTFDGKKQYGAASIVDETDNLNPDNQNLQQVFKNNGEDWTKKKLIGKEWTVFTNNRDILPLYGTYYYFFPEVDGKFNVKFYCEGDLEHLPLWYKFDANDGLVPFNDQLHLEMKRNGVTINTNDSDHKFFIGGNTKYDEPYYEYTVEFKKGGVYYLCSNPNNYDMERPILRLISYGFIPTFRVDPLYSVVANGTKSISGAATIKGVSIDKFEGTPKVDGDNQFSNDATITINGESAPLIKCLGNIKKEGTVIKLRKDGDDIKLDFDNIAYKDGDNINKGGAIIVNLDCPAGKATFVLTVAYSAADATMDNNSSRNGVTTQVKKWDFFSGAGEGINGWDIGKYGTVDDGDKSLYSTDYSAWQGKSKLFKEVNKYGGLTADWIKTYMDLKGYNEPIFKSVYDMEGDNADMLHETAGLVFLTESNLMGIYNENGEYNSSDKTFQDRYIGLLGPSELPLKNEVTGEEHPRALIIPYLKDGDRVVIKMGRYGNSSDGNSTAILKITGAKDANGTPITSDYVIGGSHELEAGDKSKPYGEYHFIKDGDDRDYDAENPTTNKAFKLEVKDAPLLKIYSIEIYRSDNLLTENRVLGNNREILYTDKDGGATKQMKINLHYWGLAETQATLNTLSGYNTGKFKTSVPSFSTNDDHNFTFTPGHDLFGSFRTRIGVKTRDDNKSYVTDYADCNLAVGYRETKTYPYTWDFTDLKKYAILTGELDNNGTENGDVADMKTWNNYGLRVSPENADGCLFVSGGQLYAGATMFPETKGIGIYHVNNDTRRNGVMTITGDGTTESGGLQVNDNRASDNNPLLWEYLVPSVKSEQAVYVHAKKVSGAKTSQAKYLMNIQSLDLLGTNANYVPKGWTCKQGENDFHESGIDYSINGVNGSRVFEGFSGYQGKALYWRQGYAEYGFKDDYQLILQPGEYVLTYTMAAWKESPEYKVEVIEYTGGTIKAESNYITATPNANGNSSTDLSGAERNQLSFTIGSTGRYIIRFSQKGDGFLEFLLLECNLTSEKKNFEYTATDANGDDIFAMSLPKNATESDVRLCFQGYEVNKIAVSTEQEHKNLNVKGWATESRDHDIDASLTSYMTGKDIKTYIVTTVNSKDRYATLTDVSDKRMPLAAADDSENACILFNNTDKGPLNVFGANTGFHLFVPDMHDTEKETPVTGNLLRAKLTPGEMSVGTENTVNYVFTYQYVKINPETGAVISGDRENDEMAFYRLGTQRTVTSIGNQAYLPVSTSDASRSVLFYLNYAGGESDPTVIDALLPTEPKEAAEPLRYYNLNGQQLDSKPNRSGLYIVNGKKKYIKIK